MVSERGIETKLEKVEGIVWMHSPCNLQEVQMLAYRVAALNHFITQSTDQCFPIFNVLRKAQAWDAVCEEAFTNLKNYLAHPPLLSQTKPGENLTVYLAMSPHAIWAMLV